MSSLLDDTMGGALHRFADRRAAGRELATVLKQTPFAPAQTLVLGLPRGGVPVAAEVAQGLGAELDVLVVRKIGLPMQPEFAIGAIAPGGIVVQESPTLHELGLTEARFTELIRRERIELERRERLYRRGRPPLRLGGRTIVLVDDGIATGASMLAAVRAARAAGASSITVAAPVGSIEAATRLRAESDRLVVLEIPASFEAVGEWYEEFPQTGDAEVCECLQHAAEH